MRIILLLLLGLTFGCSTNPGLRTEPGVVEGKLESSDGKVVGNVGLTFQPLDNGFVTTLQVAEDGSFKGDLVPGKYAYYVGKSSSKNADQSLKKVDSKFQEADMSRTVVIEASKPVSLVLK
jgi:hypothetical protein